MRKQKSICVAVRTNDFRAASAKQKLQRHGNEAAEKRSRGANIDCGEVRKGDVFGAQSGTEMKVR